jgi:hypothetical protein
MGRKPSRNPLILLVLFFAVLLLTLAFVSAGPSLVGKWSIMNLDGSPAGEFVSFNKDSTYTVALPDGKIGESGYFFVQGSVFSIRNSKNVCGNGYWGKYDLKFYGEDSVHFALIEDTCTERRMDLVGYNPGLRRYKEK